MRDRSKTNRKLLDILLSKFDVNMTDNRGRSALHRAAFFNNTECISTLLENNAKVDLPDENGKTALIIAAARGAIQSIQLLIEKGANCLLTDAKGKTSEDYWKNFHRKMKCSCPPFPSVGRQNGSAVKDELDDWVNMEKPDSVEEKKSDVDVHKLLARVKQLEAEVESYKDRTKLLTEVLSEEQDESKKKDEQ